MLRCRAELGRQAPVELMWSGWGLLVSKRWAWGTGRFKHRTEAVSLVQGTHAQALGDSTKNLLVLNS